MSEDRGIDGVVAFLQNPLRERLAALRTDASLNADEVLVIDDAITLVGAYEELKAQQRRLLESTETLGAEVRAAFDDAEVVLMHSPLHMARWEFELIKRVRAVVGGASSVLEFYDELDKRKAASRA